MRLNPWFNVGLYDAVSHGCFGGERVPVTTWRVKSARLSFCGQGALMVDDWTEAQARPSPGDD